VHREKYSSDQATDTKDQWWKAKSVELQAATDRHDLKASSKDCVWT